MHAKNFLSLKNVEVELGKLYVLIGSNASGNSGITRALQPLANHVKSGAPLLPGYRSFSGVVRGFGTFKSSCSIGGNR